MIKKDYKTLALPAKYVPKKTEKYMCDEQKAFFYRILMEQKKELEEVMIESDEAPRLAQKMDSLGTMDEGDAATLSIETDLAIKMQTQNLGLMKYIDAALERLKNGTYGYSVISGEEIGLRRLMARPVATTTQAEREEYEK